MHAYASGAMGHIAGSAAAATDEMPPMEHPANTLAVPPLVEPRVLNNFCQAIRLTAQRTGEVDKADEAITLLRARLDELRSLAQLCRLAVLGHPRSFGQLKSELKCLAVDFPSDAIQPRPATYTEDEPDHRFNLTAALDLFTGAAFVSKDQPDQLRILVTGIVRAIESFASFPIAYSEESAALIAQTVGPLTSVQVNSVMATALRRLLEGDVRCDPELPDRFRTRLEALALDWLDQNPVGEMFRALGGPPLANAIEMIDPDDVNPGGSVWITTSTTLRDYPGDPPGLSTLLKSGFVLFCPAQPGRVLALEDLRLQVEVPQMARTGPIALVRKPPLKDVIYQLNHYAAAYPDAWTNSLFPLISLSKWAYPTAYGPPEIEVSPIPSFLTIRLYSKGGSIGPQMAVKVGERLTVQYRVDPPGSTQQYPVQASATLGTLVAGNSDDTLFYTPDQAGQAVIRVTSGPLSDSAQLRVVN